MDAAPMSPQDQFSELVKSAVIQQLADLTKGEDFKSGSKPEDEPTIWWDIAEAMKQTSMKRSFFDKYIRHTPEMRLVEFYPTNPETGEVSNKPYYEPEKFREAARKIQERWELAINK
ncbi:hypothetical protein [Levilactobacillus bambusae]|nr:hypothetical protein [Levilactobacillus bambusae]